MAQDDDEVLNLADILDDNALEAMAVNAGHAGLGRDICQAYGIERPDGPDTLRDLLRERLGKPGRGRIPDLVSGLALNAEAARVIETAGLDTVDVKAIALWSNEAISLEAGDFCISAYANRDKGRMSVSVHLGSAPGAGWDFDEDDLGRDTPGLLELQQALPEAVMVAAIGRPLESLVAHRLIEPGRLVVKDARAISGGTMLELARA